MKPKKALKMLTALAQETRMEVFRLLIQEGPDGLSAGMIAKIMNIPQTTLSFHLSMLKDAGLIKAIRNGRTINYAAKYKSIKNLNAFLTENSYKKQLKKTEI